MDITLKIPERVFRTAKTPEQVANEIRQAAALFWVARGDVAAEAMGEITAPPAPAQEATLYDLLIQGPDVGEDSDFERRPKRDDTAAQAASGGGEGSKKAAGFKEFLLLMPDVGEDADFERPVDHGRPEIEWDT